MQKAVKTQAANGYFHGAGSLDRRMAVVEYHEKWDEVRYDVDSVILVGLISV